MAAEQSKGVEKEEGKMEYICVQFEANASKKWDGREVEVPGKTVVRLGEWTVEGLEKVEVYWPGKGGKTKGKVWNCVVLPPDLEEVETGETANNSAETAPATASSCSGAGVAQATPSP